jgi:hypothetical protein
MARFAGVLAGETGANLLRGVLARREVMLGVKVPAAVTNV